MYKSEKTVSRAGSTEASAVISKWQHQSWIRTGLKWWATALRGRGNDYWWNALPIFEQKLLCRMYGTVWRWLWRIQLNRVVVFILIMENTTKQSSCIYFHAKFKKCEHIGINFI